MSSSPSVASLLFLMFSEGHEGVFMGWQNIYAKNLIVVKNNKIFKNLSYQKIVFPGFFGGPGGFREVREACRKNFHQFSSKMLRRIPSYDQKTTYIYIYIYIYM